MGIRPVKKEPIRSRPTAASERPPTAPDPYTGVLRNVGLRVSRYDLELTYRMSANLLSGVAVLSAAATSSVRRITLDLVAVLKVTRVTIPGHRVTRFSQRAGKLIVDLAAPLRPGQTLSITVKYGGNPRPIRSRWGTIGWEELTAGVLVASQPNGAASWFPCDDHPSSKAGFRISITTDSPYRAVANGQLVDKRRRGSMTTWVYEQNEPMATYLASVGIGEYQLYEITGGSVPVRALVPPQLRRGFDTDFGRQAEMMKVFIRCFGPYPFADYTVVVTADDLEIPIEAQGMSIFGANHCDGSRREERLVAHELSHQWFGNSVTLERWGDIWLNEGFACYAEWLWSEFSGGVDAHTHALKHFASLQRKPQDLLLADPGPELMFDDRVYKRGALLVHSLRLALGDDTFFALVRDWCTRYRHRTVTADDFVALAARHADASLAPLWRDWLHQTALPPHLGLE